MFRTLFYTIYSLIVMHLLSSCANTKQAVYFNGMPDSKFTRKYEALEPLIQPNDILSITITSINREASIIFNSPQADNVGITNTSGVVSEATGYLVNDEGNILLPVLKEVKAAGLTKTQLRNNISQLLVDKKLLIDPVVNIRCLNFKVTVLGEVARPNVIAVPSEKISLLEAIGLAGDLTIYAKRDNVVVIREVGNEKVVKRINLNSADLFTSDYYYLNPNDVVYVEPNKARMASAAPARQWLPVVMSSLSLAAIVIDRLTR